MSHRSSTPEAHYSDPERMPWYRGWVGAYWRFRQDPNESRLLKAAPLIVVSALIGDAATLFVPVFDVLAEIPEDLGTATFAAYALVATIHRVSQHRQPLSEPFDRY